MYDHLLIATLLSRYYHKFSFKERNWGPERWRVLLKDLITNKWQSWESNLSLLVPDFALWIATLFFTASSLRQKKIKSPLQICNFLSTYTVLQGKWQMCWFLVRYLCMRFVRLNNLQILKRKTDSDIHCPEASIRSWVSVAVIGTHMLDTSWKEKKNILNKCFMLNL